MELVRAARIGPRFKAHTLDRLAVELTELRGLLCVHEAARVHGERAAFLGRRVVEERVGLRAQYLLRERRRARELAAQHLNLTGLDSLQQQLDAVDVHRSREAIGERLHDERVIRYFAVPARQVLGARDLIREYGRQQVLRVHALELRRRLLAVAEPPHRKRDRRVPAPVRAEQRRVEDRLREHVADGRAREVTRDFVEREAVHRAERDHDRVLERRGLELEIEAAAETLAQREAPGAIHARPEWRVDHEMRVARLVEEPLEDHALRARQGAEGGLCGAEVFHDLLRGRRRDAELVA